MEEVDVFALDQTETPEDFKTLSLDDVFPLQVIEPAIEPAIERPLHNTSQLAAAGGVSSKYQPFDEPDAKRWKPTKTKKGRYLPLLSSEEPGAVPSTTHVARATVDPFPCLVDIQLPSHLLEGMKNDLRPILAHLGPKGGSVFHVREEATTEPTAADPGATGFPRFIVQIMLNNKQTRAGSAHSLLLQAFREQQQWTEIDTHRIDYTELFVHKHCPEVGFGIALAQLVSGVKFLLTVNGKEALHKATEFYKTFLTGQIIPTDSYVIFKLDKESEFLIRSDSAAPLIAVNSTASLCFLPETAPNLPPFIGPDRAGWWTATDPDGNIVNVKSKRQP